MKQALPILTLIFTAAPVFNPAPSFAAEPAPAPAEAAKPAAESAKPAAEAPKPPPDPALVAAVAATPLQKKLDATRDQRMKWWRDARFGMFIHWGVYAVPAGKWKGQEVKRSGAEWIMNRGKIPVADYQKLPAQFNPTKFDATAWVDLAKQAGMKYIVITAKHHDGFAMYRSKVDPFNIYDATPFKRDPLRELVDAAKKAGIKLGFYYSQAQDWNHRGGAASGGHWDPQAQDGSMDEYLDKIAVPQVKELLSSYGPVSVLWWDTPADMTVARGEKFTSALALAPNLVVNNRLWKTKTGGDFETPEQKIPAAAMANKDWETCMTINGTWGFRAGDENWKSTETLVRNLIDIGSKGGNFLLNVGPTAEGVIPEPSVERLRQVGAWMKVNGDAIYGTTGSPLATPPAWGRITKRMGPAGGTIYLHVFDWPKDGKLTVTGLGDLGAKIGAATLLATGKKLAVGNQAGQITITVPTQAPDAISSTIALQVSGRLAAR
jgi:alpha-L-fucosidase